MMAKTDEKHQEFLLNTGGEPAGVVKKFSEVPGVVNKEMHY